MPSVYRFGAVLFDLFGTLVDERGNACEGAPEAISVAAALPWAVVTSCPRDVAFALLSRASLPHPQELVGAEDVRRPKPSPEGYALAAQRLGIEPERCVVFEDTASGVAAARAAGMHAISVRRGWQHVELAVNDGELCVTERG